MNVAVAVGDESLHTVQTPAVFLRVVGCTQHDRLEVGTGIGFGEVHRHGFACTNAWYVFLSLLFVAEAVECFDTVLERPYVFEACIACTDDFVGCGIYGHRQVQTFVATRHGHAVEACLACCVEVFVGLGSVGHASVGAVRSLAVHVLSVGCNHVGVDVAYHFEHLVVAVHCVFEVLWSIVILVLVLEAAFLEFHDALHQWVFHVELYLWVVCV